MRLTVEQIVEEAIIAFWEGRITAAQASTIKDLAKVHCLLQHREPPPMPCLTAEVHDPDDADMGQLVKAMAQAEWTPRDLRALAVEHGLFRGWLNADTTDHASVQSRFGLLCERSAGREFPEGVFLVRGRDRKRHYVIRPGRSGAADYCI